MRKPERRGKLGGDGVFVDGFGGKTCEKRETGGRGCIRRGFWWGNLRGEENLGEMVYS